MQVDAGIKSLINAMPENENAQRALFWFTLAVAEKMRGAHIDANASYQLAMMAFDLLGE